MNLWIFVSLFAFRTLKLPPALRNQLNNRFGHYWCKKATISS